jgi:hypothetical protein
VTGRGGEVPLDGSGSRDADNRALGLVFRRGGLSGSCGQGTELRGSLSEHSSSSSHIPGTSGGRDSFGRGGDIGLISGRRARRGGEDGGGDGWSMLKEWRRKVRCFDKFAVCCRMGGELAILAIQRVLQPLYPP